MAVQKSKKSRARRDMRRSHHGASAPTYSIDSTTGEMHRRHNITPNGYYRGKQVMQIKLQDQPAEEGES